LAETSASLLDGLQKQDDPAAWPRLVALYTPLIRGWLRQHARLDQDADDLVQDILAVVVRKLPDFRREPRTGAFRRWLKNITVNCLRNSWRARRTQPVAPGNSAFAEMLRELEDPESALSRLWDQEHDRYVMHHLLGLIRPCFQPATWRAFERVALDGIPPDQVAEERGVSVNSVFIAKSRVLARLRQEGRDLID
jgi:RNA polymerase sigma-70 factor (ECF subfamily)